MDIETHRSIACDVNLLEGVIAKQWRDLRVWGMAPRSRSGRLGGCTHQTAR